MVTVWSPVWNQITRQSMNDRNTQLFWSSLWMLHQCHYQNRDGDTLLNDSYVILKAVLAYELSCLSDRQAVVWHACHGIICPEELAMTCQAARLQSVSFLAQPILPQHACSTLNRFNIIFKLFLLGLIFLILCLALHTANSSSWSTPPHCHVMPVVAGISDCGTTLGRLHDVQLMHVYGGVILLD